MSNNQAPSSGNFLDSQGNARNIIDRVTGAPKGINTDHSYIHKGYMYSASIGPVTLAAGETRRIAFKTPPVTADQKYVHWRPSLISTSADKLTMTLFEEPTGVAGGSVIPSVNRNRIHGDPAQSVVTDGVTVTGNGIEVDKAYLGGGTGVGQDRSGSEVGETNEIVMKVNADYLTALANGSSGPNIVFIKLLWYEEDDA